MAQQDVEGVDVGDVDAQEVVDVARDVVAADESVELDDPALEALHGVGGVVDEDHAEVHDEAAPDRAGVEHRPVPADHALALQTPQAALCRGRRDRHRLGEIGQAGAPVRGQVREDRAVGPVELGGSGGDRRRHGWIVHVHRSCRHHEPGIARAGGRIVEA